VPIKSADKKVPIKSTDKKVPITQNQKEKIISMAGKVESIRNADVTQALQVGESRAKTLLRELVSDGKLVPIGDNKSRVYRLRLYTPSEFNQTHLADSSMSGDD
jgi:predicted HTH transcriptional regulator